MKKWSKANPVQYNAILPDRIFRLCTDGEVFERVDRSPSIFKNKIENAGNHSVILYVGTHVIFSIKNAL
jgi:hypothetical protein